MQRARQASAGSSGSVCKTGTLQRTNHYIWNTADALGKGATAIVYFGRHKVLFKRNVCVYIIIIIIIIIMIIIIIIIIIIIKKYIYIKNKKIINNNNKIIIIIIIKTFINESAY